MARAETKVKERISRLREKIIDLPAVCIERGYFMTESYRQTESEPPVIRRAKALAKVLNEMTIHIEDGELIVGRTTSKPRGGALLPEVRWEWPLEQIDSLSTRDRNRYLPLTEEERTKMKEFLPYWKGKALYDKWRDMIPENALKLFGKIEVTCVSCANTMHLGHVSVDYEMVLTKGLKGVKRQVDEEIGKLNLAEIKDFEKFQFLSAVNITIEAVMSFAKRHAKLASTLAEKEPNIQRKAELEKIAETCNWVPANPARDFYEALQSVWFTYVAVMIEGWGYGISFGRADQYLYPFYKEDIKEAKITREEARELLALFLIKINGSVVPVPLETASAHGGHPITCNITLGGVTKDGRDAVNELSYLFLDAEKEVGLSAEDFVIRVHSNTPDAFLMKACEVAKLLRGKLKFVSDETSILQLLTDGKPMEYARQYCITGCTSPTVPGLSHDIIGGQFNLPLMLELALNNGVSRITSEQMGPKTGDPRKFKTYDEVWDAYKKQVEAAVPIAMIFKNVDRQVFAEFAPTPFQSALFHGCIDKGTDIQKGGTAPYLHRAISLAGAPNVGDSLAAIKKAVFDDKKTTMDRLINALDKNFVGEEEVLQILKGAPKFGNDNDYVDVIVNEVLTHASNEVAKYKGIAGAISASSAQVATANLPMGWLVGALPDGRKAGEPLSEGGISPYQGRNLSGPTSTAMSVAKLDHTKLTNGAVLNMRFNPDALKDESKMRKFASLIRTFCEIGGHIVQFNVVSTETLRDAQKNPEQYRDLLVRVATYSAYYVELSPDLQNDIIARIEFQDV